MAETVPNVAVLMSGVEELRVGFRREKVAHVKTRIHKLRFLLVVRLGLK